jgi:transcriptional regulator with XRE-family HTH domain
MEAVEIRAQALQETPQEEPQSPRDLLSAIGETLRSVRNERSLTLRQVSEGSHVSVSYLAEIERGEKDPSSRVLESVAFGLDIEVSELLIKISAALEPVPEVPVSDSIAA